MNVLQKMFVPRGSELAKKEAVGGTLGKLKTVNEQVADQPEAATLQGRRVAMLQWLPYEMDSNRLRIEPTR